MTGGPLLAVEDLRVAGRRGALVDGVSFQMERGDLTGLIGESGSGKTLTALAILGLLPENLRATGSIRMAGREMIGREESELCAVRGNQISMIFQEPMTALNPVMRVGRQIAEALRTHQGLDRAGAMERATVLLDRVGVEHPEVRVRAYPHQLSGGQRQRVMIAMALACGPDLVIADEPTTALDVTVQARVLSVLRTQIEAENTALLLITHDLPVVAGVCGDVLVMHDGQIVERGSTQRVFGQPSETYTRELVAAVPPLSRSADAITEVHSPAQVDTSAHPMVAIEALERSFRLPRTRALGRPREIHAVNQVTLSVHRGETFGIVGESGSGKSTLARMIVGLDRPDRGTVEVDGKAVTTSSDLSWLRRTAQMVFQDPMGSLDPRMTVGDVIAEPLRSLRIPVDHFERVRELLEAVALPADSVYRYPHEFSGGQRQRVAIARALAPHPELLVADEPVSALDMSVQTKTLRLLEDLQRAFNLTMIFISHDLSVVHEICDRVAVMQHGAVVEEGTARELFAHPSHPYTRRLLSAIPRLDGSVTFTD